MILTPKCYTRDWLFEQAARTGTQNVVLEKCIHALTLVAALSEEGLEFVFKGGTSLMLHLNPVRRLSIVVTSRAWSLWSASPRCRAGFATQTLERVRIPPR